MKFLFVCHRWGGDLVGGAEIHHRRLVRDLMDLGHEVEVWTTTGREIEPVAHWAVQWHEGYARGEAVEDGVRVRRWPLKPVRRELLGLGAKWLQRRMEESFVSLMSAEAQDFVARAKASLEPCLLSGWHLPELENGRAVRWTGRRSSLVLPALRDRRVELTVSGFAPKRTRLIAHTGAGKRVASGPLKGWFTARLALEPWQPLVELETTRCFRPLKDHRTLGVRVTEVCWRLEVGPEERLDLWDDMRALGRRHFREWSAVLWRHGQDCPERAGRVFDWLRGPRCPGLARALRNPPADCDAVIAGNLPWSILPMVARNLPREAKLLAMPLWHVEDDYYYWPQYAEALRRADLILANTQFSAREFFGRFLPGNPAAFVGPGVPEPPRETPAGLEAAAWKEAHGIGRGEFLVLSVSRKSPEKRYEVIGDAVAMLRVKGKAARFALVGPDADGRPVDDGVRLLGRLDDAELDAAYRVCDAFALMSDSESFGMVLAEAMMR
ncbi:MAG: glycosyltransferase, partial [Sumerlaeia bacterium]